MAAGFIFRLIRLLCVYFNNIPMIAELMQKIIFKICIPLILRLSGLFCQIKRTAAFATALPEIF